MESLCLPLRSTMDHTSVFLQDTLQYAYDLVKQQDEEESCLFRLVC